MKTIAIFCPSVSKHEDPFKDPKYWDSYSDLLLFIKERGANAYLTSDPSTYKGDGVFLAAYGITTKGPIEGLKDVGQIKAGLVFDRGGFTPRDVPVINPDLVAHMGASKIETYKRYAKYQPFSIICHNKNELIKAIDTIETNKVVVKEDDSIGGQNIYIDEKSKILEKVPDTYPLLVQEFMDTSAGIPGYVEGMHDLRVEIGGGEIWGCFIRTPKKGEYRANVALGGSKIILSHSDVPAEVVRIVHEIDASYTDYPRFYALDFAHTDKGWKLIEINSRRVGLVAASDGPGSRYRLNKLAEYLVAYCPDSSS